mmetsp:Transcript_4534/g.6318  ORF Transcript_4534/g.6318 Transcript_4534/m.6318 type:complete len:110 (+) Transcript_4534:2-331(+)
MSTCATETWLEDGSIESWARSVYLRYNPERAGDLEALLVKYHGREDQLLRGISEKYSVPVPSHLAHLCKSEPTERVEHHLRRTTKASQMCSGSAQKGGFVQVDINYSQG